MRTKEDDATEVALDTLIEVISEGSNVLKPAPELTHIQTLGADVAKRELYVMDEITEDFGLWFTTAIRYLEKHSHDPITVWLSTPGGSVESMFTFHDLVRTSPCEITIIATGQVCSAGVLMLACGDKRMVTESTILMSHRSQDEMSGNLEQMESYLKVMKWGEDHWSELMARYTPDFVEGKARDQRYWFQLGKKNAEWWIMGGKAIVREGLADAIYNGPGK
jgi:ATP-dependent Clp protease protease subunit